MPRFARKTFALVLGAAGLFAAPGPAKAQFYGGYGINVNTRNGIGPFGLPIAVPNAYYVRGTFASIPNPLGGGSISYGQVYYGPAGYYWANRNNNNNSSPSSFLTTPTYNAYMSGGVRNPAVDNAPGAFGKAQRQATDIRANAARSTIYDQWAYEKVGVAGLPGVRPGEVPPEAIARALAAPDLAQVVSGEALNHVVVAVLATQERGGKGDSAFL